MNAQQIDDYLNRRSGILGISGLSSDFRDLESAANRGDERSQLAIDIFAYKVKNILAAMLLPWVALMPSSLQQVWVKTLRLCVIRSVMVWNILVRVLIRNLTSCAVNRWKSVSKGAGQDLCDSHE